MSDGSDAQTSDDGTPADTAATEAPASTIGTVGDTASPTGDSAASATPPGQVLTKRHSYLVRHWRGELSLGVAYWLNGVAGNVVIVLVTGLVGALVTDYRPVPSLIGGIVTWLAFLVVTVWQVVGISRSAIRHTDRGGRSVWAFLAMVMMIIGVIRAIVVLAGNAVPQLAEHIKIVQGDVAFARHQLRLVRGGTELEFAGGITFGLAEEVGALLDRTPQVRVIHLASQGGRLAEARRLKGVIAAHGLTTYVANYCYSACVVAFMGGKERVVGPDGRLGLHQGRFPGVATYMIERQDAVDKAALLAAGVAPAFVERAYKTPNSELWVVTAAELVDARVATRIAAPTEFASSRFGEAMTAVEIGQLYMTVPPLAAASRAAPEIFGALMQDLSTIVAEGRSDAEVEARVHAATRQLFVKFAPVAGDAAIVQYGAVVADEIEQLGAKDPDACYVFVAGTGLVNIAAYVGAATIQLDLAGLAKVIETGAATPQSPPDPTVVAAAMREVVGQLRATYGTDADLLGHLTKEPVDHQKACRLSASLYRAILALPDARPSAVLRQIFGNLGG